MATVPELWVKLYKGVFLKIDGLQAVRAAGSCAG